MLDYRKSHFMGHPVIYVECEIAQCLPFECVFHCKYSLGLFSFGSFFCLCTTQRLVCLAHAGFVLLCNYNQELLL